MKRLSEKQIIRLLQSALGIHSKKTLWNDDVATLPLQGRLLVLKCDMLVQSTDVPKQMRPWQAARKSIVSCVSDMACKGVRPLATLVSLAIPRYFTSSDVRDMVKGFRIAEREFGINIIGGDTNEGKELTIDCCMAGVADRIVRRSGARIGDLIITSGPFGYPAAGLRILKDGARCEPGFRKKVLRAVMVPEPRLKFGLGLARYATSTMDSSDGLAITLHELSRASRKRFVVEQLPAALGVREFAKTNRYRAEDLVLYGGEEYEIVATIPKRDLDRVGRLAKASGCRLHVLGQVESGSGLVRIEDRRTVRIEERGWEHLSR